MERTISSREAGSNRIAAAFATSGMEDVFEHATARPHAIASRIGRPKPS